MSPPKSRRQLAASGFAARLKPGSRVAIGVGSRGIHNIATIVRSVVRYWKDQGMQPFLFPAMGSHGAASAEGQADVLAHYGITEAAMGCPLVSQLDVVSLGKTADGIEAFMDRAAYESDGVMLVGRVKWHTDFDGKIESGLFKMMAIGLGKFAGAQRYHAYAYRLGLEHVIRSIGRQVLKSGKILGGLAILEDAHHNTAKLDAVPVEMMEQREEENLALVKSWMAKIPVDLDILILDEIGKNISGAGMDTKVVNRGVNGEYNPWPDTPQFERVFVRDLSELTYNSAVGLGMADVVTDRLVNRINWEPTLINSLTANTPAAIRTPDPLPHRPRVPRAHRPHGGQARSIAGHLRLDSQHHGAGPPRPEREPAGRDRREPADSKSKPPSTSISTAGATSSVRLSPWKRRRARTNVRSPRSFERGSSERRMSP